MTSELRQLSGCSSDDENLYATISIAFPLFETSNAEEVADIMYSVCSRWNGKEGYLTLKEYLHLSSYRQLPFLMRCIAVTVGRVDGERFYKGVLLDLGEMIEQKYLQRNSVAVVETNDEDEDEIEDDDEIKIPFNSEIAESFNNLLPYLMDLIKMSENFNCRYDIMLFSSYILHAAHGSMPHEKCDNKWILPREVFNKIKETIPSVDFTYLFGRVLTIHKRSSKITKITIGVSDSEDLFPCPSDSASYPGIVSLLYYVGKPKVVSSTHYLTNVIPYVMSALTSPALGVLQIGLESCLEVLSMISSYSICLYDQTESVDRKQLLSDKELVGTDLFELFFELAQRLSSVMVQCPVSDFREKSDNCLQRLFKILQETSRFKMYTYFIKSCPFHCVVGLIYNRLKNEIADEYAACDQVGDSIASHSSFLKTDLFIFTIDLISESSCSMEVILSGMSFLLFVVLREKRTPLLNISSAQMKRLVSTVTTIKERRRDDDNKNIQIESLLLFTSDRLLEAASTQ